MRSGHDEEAGREQESSDVHARVRRRLLEGRCLSALLRRDVSSRILFMERHLTGVFPHIYVSEGGIRQGSDSPGQVEETCDQSGVW